MIYAESSAVLAWLLGDEGGTDVAGVLSDADGVIASDLTLVECGRVLIRYEHADVLTEAEAADQRAALARVSTQWTVLRIQGEVIDRARRPFPIEPVRTLDALHLASALLARSVSPGVRLLSLDERVRENGQQLGFEVLP